jgi:hypothetical protein
VGFLTFPCVCLLQDDDAVNAEIYIKKASFLVNSCKEEALELQYKVGGGTDMQVAYLGLMNGPYFGEHLIQIQIVDCHSWRDNAKEGK